MQPESNESLSASDVLSRAEAVDHLIEPFNLLVEAAVATHRDWKLVAALLEVTVELLSKHPVDLFQPTEQPQDALPRRDGSRDSEGASASQKQRLNQPYRDRIEAVIDSWSDDETAWHLRVGLRQIRRRAQRGELYYFEIARKRRFPIWQFNDPCGVLPRPSDIARSAPRGWRPEHLYRFMTAPHPDLEFDDRLLSPSQWLRLGLPSERITFLIGPRRP
ncbi:hypothetical protein SRABI98_00029 [Microbacterium sp. Bi98]|nr:hypothetical protein SRABI98_00029 [Microbacterium sp. Bi98]